MASFYSSQRFSRDAGIPHGFAAPPFLSLLASYGEAGPGAPFNRISHRNIRRLVFTASALQPASHHPPDGKCARILLIAVLRRHAVIARRQNMRRKRTGALLDYLAHRVVDDPVRIRRGLAARALHELQRNLPTS